MTLPAELRAEADRLELSARPITMKLLHRAADALEWRGIESAPKGGGAEYTTAPNWVEPPTILLAFPGGNVAAGQYEWYYAEGGNGYVEGLDAWCESVSSEQLCLTYGNPTHWLPLPATPEGD